MTKLFDKAEQALADLPEKDQRELIDQLVEGAAVRKLKAMIDEGRVSLERGEGERFDIEAIIEEARARHAGS